MRLPRIDFIDHLAGEGGELVKCVDEVIEDSSCGNGDLENSALADLCFIFLRSSAGLTARNKRY